MHPGKYSRGASTLLEYLVSKHDWQEQWSRQVPYPGGDWLAIGKYTFITADCISIINDFIPTLNVHLEG
jgi:hypothetical protein